MYEPKTSLERTIVSRQRKREMLLEAWIPADAQAVPEARRRAIRICSQSGLSEIDCDALDLALGEALANAVLYGALENKQASFQNSICLRIWDYRSKLIIQVHDYGPGFDPPLPPYPMPLPSSGALHGRGLPLMQNLTDGLLVCREDVREGGASVYLVKKIPHQAQESPC